MSPRNARKVVLKNAFSLSALQMLNYILPIIILPYLVRIIGAGKFGLIAFAQALAQYFSILVDYSFNITATREISLCQKQKPRVNAIFSAVTVIKFILTLISLLIFLLIVNFVPRFRSDYLVYILSFGVVIANALFPYWFFSGIEKMKYISNLNIIAGIIYALGIFILVKGPQDYLFIPFLNAVIFIAMGITGLLIALIKFRIVFIFPGFRELIQEVKSGWSIFASNISINAYTISRVFAVGLLTNNVLTGYYSIAERIANIIQVFPMHSFTQALYPRLSRIFEKNRKRAFDLMNRIQHVATDGFMISLPIIYFLSPLIIRVAAGRAFPEAVLSLRLLLIAVFFVGANAYRVQFLLVCARQDIFSRIHITAALIGVPLIFIFIWIFSYWGAALATALIEAGVTLYTIQLTKKSSNLASGLR